MNYKIALIKGDGIGPEVVGEAVKVMDTIGAKFGHTFEYADILMGGCAIDQVGKSYPEGTAKPATRFCWARWAVPSGGTPPTRTSARKLPCCPSGRIWAFTPICAPPLCGLRWRMRAP